MFSGFDEEPLALRALELGASSYLTKTSSLVLSTGVPAGNSTIVQPTKSMSVPASLKPSASGSGTTTRSTGIPESTGAASSLQAGLSLAGVAAAFAFML